MRKVGFLVLAVGISSLAAPAFAQQPEGAFDHGLEFGVRLGYGIAAGKEGAATGATSANLSDDVSGMIPIILDGGYRVNPNLYVGLSFQYGWAFVNTGNANNAACTQGGVSCSASDIRLGLNLHYHFLPGQSFDPWLGIGVGYEWLGLEVSDAGQSADATASGFEFANLQLGGDIPVAPNFAVGPFLSVSFGQYQSISVSEPGYPSMSMDLTSKDIHEWFVFGVRGVYDIRM